MTTTEDQVRRLLRDLAERAEPTPMLERLERHAPVVRRQRRSALAAALAVAVAGTILGVHQARPDPMPQPTERPPHVFRLTDETSMSPGRADMVVTLVGQGRQGPPGSAYVLPSGGGPVVAVPPVHGTGSPSTHRLSADGTKLVRVEEEVPMAYGISVMDLVTGEVQDLDVEGVAGEISPDGTTVALYRPGEILLVDVDSLGTSSIDSPEGPADVGPAGGWLPDSSGLALHAGPDLVLVDLAGNVRRSLPSVHLANQSQSWSPDGKLILVFQSDDGRFAVQPADGGEATPLEAPPDAVRALGWAGDRIVWLTGQPGDQRLVTTDQRGREPTTWMVFDVGDAAVDSVTWSRALSG